MSFYFDVSTEYDFGTCGTLALADEDEDHAPGRGGDDWSFWYGPREPVRDHMNPVMDHMILDGTDYGPCGLALAAQEDDDLRRQRSMCPSPSMEEQDDILPKQRGGSPRLEPRRRGALALVADYFEDREALAPYLQDSAVPWAHQDSLPATPALSSRSRRSTWPKAPPCRSLLPAEEDVPTPSTASHVRSAPIALGRKPCLLGSLPAEEVSTPSTASHPPSPWSRFDDDLGDLGPGSCGGSSSRRPGTTWDDLGDLGGRSSCDSSSKASRGSWSPVSCGYPTLPRQQWPGWPNACVQEVPSLRDWEVPPSGRGGALGAGHEKVSHDEWGRPGSPVHGPLGLEHFDFIRTVGTGFLGRVSVVKMRRALSGAPLVLKVMEKSTVLAKKQVQHVLNERQIMSSIKHPFCVSVVASFQDDSRLFLLMDYISGGELFSYTRVTQGLQPSVARFFASEVASALQYLHELDIIYRDLKPENVLLDGEGHVKITDFGFAKVVQGRTYTICGTAVYMAPEIIERIGHGKPADWWAFGVFVFELLTGTTPFVGRPADVYRQACNDEVRFPSRMEDDERDLISRLMNRDPSRRLGNDRRFGEASDVRAHPWFGTLDWDRVLQKRYQPPLAPWSKCLDYVSPTSEFDGLMTGCFDDGQVTGCFDGHELASDEFALTEEQQALFNKFGSCFGAR